MQQVSAIASSSRDYIDTTSPIAESDETHAQAAIVYGGDIGKVYEHVQQLDNENKYSLLKNPFVPTSSYKFPATTDEYGEKRKFQHSWLNSFPGLVYSPCTNGGFCKCCVLFGKSETGQLGILISRPLENFRKATEILRDHFCGKQSNGMQGGKLSDINAVTDSMSFINFMEKKSSAC